MLRRGFGLYTFTLAALARYKCAQPHRIKHLLPVRPGSVLAQECGEKGVAETHCLGQPRAVVQDAFRSSKRLSRFDIAELISERYPELHPRLPAKRKLTENEPFQLRMFNAAAVGIAFRRMSHHKAHEV
jgi:hypothetical protein